jgi:hypothetical protein
LEELETAFSIGHHDRSVIDPEKKFVGWAMPLCRPFVRRKMQDFERMSVGIFEVEGRNSSGVRVPRWQ